MLYLLYTSFFLHQLYMLFPIALGISYLISFIVNFLIIRNMFAIDLVKSKIIQKQQHKSKYKYDDDDANRLLIRR